MIFKTRSKTLPLPRKAALNGPSEDGRARLLGVAEPGLDRGVTLALGDLLIEGNLLYPAPEGVIVGTERRPMVCR